VGELFFIKRLALFVWLEYNYHMDETKKDKTEMMEFKTDLVELKVGSTVLCWDNMFEKNQDRDDKISCHGEVGLILDKARPDDLDSNGRPLRGRATDCYVVVFPSSPMPMVVHSAWLKIMNQEEVN